MYNDIWYSCQLNIYLSTPVYIIYICRFSRSALWVGTSSFMILAIPVVFEQERYNLQQQQEQHQRQVSVDKLSPTKVIYQRVIQKKNNKQN